MLAQIPVDFTKVDKKDLNKEILRLAIIAELDAINLYEQMAALTNDKDLKMVLLDIAKEEKTHVGEFQALLLRLDAEQEQEMAHGKKEVQELTGK
ncbi:MAG: ferritin family protein [Pseudomonadota bacterium]